MNLTKDICLICNNWFYEEDSEDEDGFVICPYCGSEDFQPYGYDAYEEDDNDQEDYA